MSKNILDLLEQDGYVTSQKTATEYSSACPICGGKDRFTIWIDKNRFYCRGCEITGDIIQYLISCRALSYPEACRTLGIEPKQSNKMGLNGVPKSTKRETTATWQPKKAQSIKPEWTTKAQSLVNYYHKQLLNNQNKLDWLLSDRGITLETVKKSKLGWISSTIYRDRSEWGLPEALKADGTIKGLWIPSGLVIPCYNISNELVRIKIRLNNPKINNKKSLKYYLLPGSSISLTFIGKLTDTVFLVESELDALLIHQEAQHITVASTGGTKVRPNLQETEALKSLKQLLLAFDSDDAGTKDSVKFWLKEFKNNAKYFSIPAQFGKDATEAHLKGFPLKMWVDAATEPEEPTKKYSEVETQKIIEQFVILAGNQPDDTDLITIIDAYMLAEEAANTETMLKLLIEMEAILNR